MKSFAIIPAAGQSTRMGRPKLLLPWNDRTIIEHVLEIWQQSGVDHRIVVVSEQGRLAEVCRAAGADVCVPNAPLPEMKDSIEAGLSYARDSFHPTDEDAWLVAPADMPQLSAGLIRRLIEEYRCSSASVVAPRITDGHLGHPVLFPWRLAAEVPKLTGTLKDLLHSQPIRHVECQKTEVFDDVDTWKDYRRLHNQHDPTDLI